jgi:hypothetical protein
LLFFENPVDEHIDEEYEVDDEEEKEVEEGRAQKCNKRKRSTFLPINKYKTEAGGDLFIRSSNPKSTFKIIYNHLVNCTLLCNNTEKHKMRCKQYKCSCIKNCSLSYVLRACDHCNICKYF